MRAFPHTPRPTGFTLVELLAVIAIVGVLAAIGAVALSSARASARATACASNLRQIQLANLAYAADHRGAFVPIMKNGTTVPTQGRSFWYNNAEFLSYLPKTSGKVSDQLCCPVAVAAGNGIDRSYGANTTGFTGHLDELGYVRQMLVSQIDRPAQAMAFADGLDWQVLADGANGYTGAETYTQHVTAYRHGGKANIVFYDGHTAAVTQAALAAASASTPPWKILP